MSPLTLCELLFTLWLDVPFLDKVEVFIFDLNVLHYGMYFSDTLKVWKKILHVCFFASLVLSQW